MCQDVEKLIINTLFVDNYSDNFEIWLLYLRQNSTIMQLKDQYIQLVKKDPELQGKIAKATGKSVQAVALWSTSQRTLHEKFLMKPVLAAIAEFTGVNEDSLIDQAA